MSLSWSKVDLDIYTAVLNRGPYGVHRAKMTQIVREALYNHQFYHSEEDWSEYADKYLTDFTARMSLVIIYDPMDKSYHARPLRDIIIVSSYLT